MPQKAENLARQRIWHSPWRFHVIVPTFLVFVYFTYSLYPSGSVASLSSSTPRHTCNNGNSLVSKNLAIVGAGSAGASTAYYLREFQSPCLKINTTIYERSDYVGGRSTVVHAHGDPGLTLELGGSIFVKVNHNLYSAVHDLGLKLKNAGAERPREALKALGIWDGQGFRYAQDEASTWWYDIAKLVWQYGLAPIRTRYLMKQTVNKFLEMYRSPVFPFESLTKAAALVNLTEVTTATGRAFLENNAITPDFANDIIQSSTRVNYAQNLEQIHGLETMVCMATDGAVAVDGGNFQIFSNMIETAEATLLLNTSVNALSRTKNSMWSVKSASKLSGQSKAVIREETFDAVVIAAPFQFSDISILPSSVQLLGTPEKVDYVKLHVTLLTSPHRLSPSFFGLEPSESVPEVVLTTLPDDNSAAESPFFSISTLRKFQNPTTSHDEYAYKVFSRSPLNSTFLSNLLGFEDPKTPLTGIPKSDVSWTFTKIWNSYPYLPPRAQFPAIKLYDNLYYTSGIETFISTMETSSLMGKNVAKLIANAWEEGLSEEESKVHLDM